MFKVKNIAFSAIAGFVLSFIISIISTHRFGASLLRGFLFSILFGCVCVLISVLYFKFLKDDDEVISVDSQATSNSRQSGTVDITISDEPLSEDEGTLQFDVSGNKRTLTEKDLANLKNLDHANETKISDVGNNMGNIPEAKSSSGIESPVTLGGNDVMPAFTGGQLSEQKVEKSDDSSFKPIKLGSETDVGVSSEGVTKKSVNSTERETDRKEIADLPDMENMLESEEGDSDFVENSGYQESFSTEEESFTSKKSSGSSKAASQDTETMAKAIRTLLNKE